jgi:hypothetical protein
LEVGEMNETRLTISSVTSSSLVDPLNPPPGFPSITPAGGSSWFSELGKAADGFFSIIKSVGGRVVAGATNVAGAAGQFVTAHPIGVGVAVAVAVLSGAVYYGCKYVSGLKAEIARQREVIEKQDMVLTVERAGHLVDEVRTKETEIARLIGELDEEVSKLSKGCKDQIDRIFCQCKSQVNRLEAQRKKNGPSRTDSQITEAKQNCEARITEIKGGYVAKIDQLKARLQGASDRGVQALEAKKVEIMEYEPMSEVRS